MKRWLLAIASLAIAAACSTGEPAATTTGDTATRGSTSAVATSAPATTPPTTAAPATTVAATDFPVTVSVSGRDVEIPARPDRIASLSATHTEVLFALGAGDQVVAVDMFSTSPPEAAEKEQVDAFELNVEAVAALEPDLVILAFDPGDAVAGFEALDIPVLMFDAPTDLEGAYSQWETLAAATGRGAEAASLVAETSAAIDRSVAEVPEMAHPVTYYYELDPTLYTATSGTFIGSLFTGFGMENIADPADPDGTGFPQLSPEAVIDADPDLIYLADTQCCQQDAAAVAARPGWDTLGAVERGDIVELPDDVASRWGPSVVELAERIASSLERHLEPAA
jgi:iron complex transport system substrate-binding protein